MNVYSLFFGIYVLLYVAQPISFLLFYSFSIILATLIIVSGILLGVGFYGLYKAGGGAMGIVGLSVSIVGNVIGGLLILLGNLIPSAV